ncbi:MAG: molecular chaperone HtpG [Myxococcota bacterium]|jgi:molecular chaperone HtpG
MTVETHRFEAEVGQVLRLVINSLYSNQEIFVRELVSNASDALDKLRYEALTDHSLVGDQPLEIRVVPDSDAKTLTIEDTGIGMTHDELTENLGTVAKSGSKAFVEALENAKGGGDEAVNLIGQFGVGFYSAFLVADKVEVVSRAVGSDQAWRWVSDGAEQYTLEPADREERGTAIILHLKEEAQEFANSWRVKELITRYSDYIGYPIQLHSVRYAEPVEGEDPKTEPFIEQVNKATALWQRPKSEVTDEEYNEFYKHLTNDYEGPLAHTHFRVEGVQQFTGVLFAPKRPPVDLYSQEQRHGIRLHVKRVFIMDDVREFLPMCLRFMRGVIDSDDLPLNVSRELLQDSRTVKFIQKQITKKSLELFSQLAKDKPEDYVTFWEAYGAVLKEGLHTQAEHKARIGKLVRYHSSASAGAWTSLEEYVARMPEEQKAIYYVIGESERAVKSSPHIEALAARGYEVLYMTDPIDEWAVEGLGTFEDTPLQSAMRADLSLDDDDKTDDDSKDDADAKTGDAPLDALLERFTEVLGDRVESVKASSRLTTSPVCLVVPDGGMHAHMERLLRASQPGFDGRKRIFEVNGTHALIESLSALHAGSANEDKLTDWIELLFDQALVSEGGRPEDPMQFVGRVTALMEAAAASAAAVTAS